jgi:O-antigen/teichoic acid export membrane protein
MLIFKGYFVPVIFAALARLEDPDHQSQAYRHLTRFTAYGTFPFVAVALVHGDLLIRWAFGDRWGPAVPAFKLLMLTCALRLCGGYGNDLFKISGRTWIYPVVATVNAALLTAGVLALTPVLGITGTALAVLVTIALSLGLAESLMGRWFDLSPCRLLLRPVFILAVCTVGASAVRHAAAQPGPLGFAVQALGLLAAFAALVALFDGEAVRDARRLAGLPERPGVTA